MLANLDIKFIYLNPCKKTDQSFIIVWLEMSGIYHIQTEKEVKNVKELPNTEKIRLIGACLISGYS